MKTSAMMRCPKCLETSELDNLHLLDQSFKRAWVGLTVDELNAIFDSMKTWSSFQITDVYFAIEAKLKEKNT